MKKLLMGKIALITGGSTGIGFETAKRFIEEGAQVIITSRSEKELKAACELLGGSATAVAGDVSSIADLDRLFASIKEKFGYLDIVFANAGGGAPGTIFDMTEENFDKTFAVNTKGIFFTVQKALPLLRDGSSIILSASAMHNKGGGGFSAYTASKAAVRSFARSWANDLKDRKIRVNTISPGPTKTPIFEKSGVHGEQMKQLEQAMTPLIPLGRFALPEENAAAVLFLASNESSFVTGTDLYVDGGFAQI